MCNNPPALRERSLNILHVKLLAKEFSDIGPIIVDESIIDNKTDIADTFNKYFANVGKLVTSDLPRVNIDFREYLPPPNNSSFFFKPISKIELISTVLHMGKKKSLDINGVSIAFLQEFIVQLSSPLLYIFNLSLETGKFPDIMKTSKTVPIYKGSGSKSDMNFYRGVSIIDAFSKIFEKLVSVRLLSFLESSNFFSPCQFGFLPGRSTNQAILQVVNHITKAINENKIVLAVFLDISKAFDSIPHDKLCTKLHNAGIRGLPLLWFKSYLSNRLQKVQIGPFKSNSTEEIDMSVLQGSILGVILFLIFINDIQNCSTILFSILFADDISSLLVANNINELLILANQEVKKLVDWYSSNCLSINSSKSKAMIFKSKFINLSLPTYKVGQLTFHYLPLFVDLNNPGESNITKIKPIRLVPNVDEKSIRMLGIYLDEHLDLKEHTKILRAKLSKSIFSLKAMKGILNKDCLKLVYYAHFFSHLTYSANIFCLCSNTLIKQIEVIQKKAIRIVCGVGSLHHTHELFVREEILPYKIIIDFEALKFMYDYVNLNLPIIFDNTWRLNWEFRPEISLRNDNDFFLPHVRYVYLFNHPFFYFPQVWNNLELETRLIDTKFKFISKIKDELFFNV